MEPRLTPYPLMSLGFTGLTRRPESSTVAVSILELSSGTRDFRPVVAAGAEWRTDESEDGQAPK